MFRLENKGSLPDDFQIGRGDHLPEIHIHANAGQNASVMIQMPDMDRTYEFYCTIPGHKDAGMFGDLIIGQDSSDDGEDGILVFNYLTFLVTGSGFIIARKLKQN